MRIIKKNKGSNSIEVKRFYVPFALEWKCPGCNSDNTKDFGGDYLMYPALDAPIEIDMYCHTCELEGTTTVQLGLTMTLVSNEVVENK